jgi:hypothetical protein
MFGTNLSKKLGRLGMVACLAASAGLAGTALADVEVEITEIRGAAAVKRAGTDEWVRLNEGDVLREGDVVRLPGNFTEVRWRRTDADGCGNEGKVGTGLSKIKEVEVGKEIRSAAPPATYFHAPSGEGQDAGEVTITETRQCDEQQHCGVSSDLAAAAAMDHTPDGAQTVFNLENVHNADGQVIETVIGNSPQSPIPIFSSALFGPMSEELFLIPPGEAIRWMLTDRGEVIPFPEPYQWAFCPADFNDDGRIDTQDVLAFLNAWNAGMPGADFNGDGRIDTQDVLAFLNAWTRGC